MAEKIEKKLSPLEIKINAFITDHLTWVPFVQKMLFIHHLQIMTRAGLSIVNSLKILSEEIENKKLRQIIEEVKKEVETGKQLSEALYKYPKFFPSIYVSMIAAGEAAGKMEDSLTQIYNQMRKSHELSSKIRGAMVYPAVIIVAMVGISIEVVVVILPKMMIMFKEFDAELPLATRILIKITDAGQVLFTTYVGLIVLAVLIPVIIGLRKLYQKPNIKKSFHSFFLRLPIFGAIVKKIALARFTLTLSSLLQSTIPIIEAVRISSDTMGNLLYRDNLLSTSESLKKGEQLSAILSRYPRTFPPMVTEMIMVGEETGEVEKMLGELSEYYSNEVDETMRNFSTIIEPVIILALGLGVAGIAVAVIMPMYSLAQSF